MKRAEPTTVRVACYTRVSTDERLGMAFSSIHAQAESVAAFVLSQRGKGWDLLAKRYDDGGYSGGTTDRPAFQDLLRDVEARALDIVAVYRLDRLARNQLDLLRTLEFFQKHDVKFVSISEDFNTATPMGRFALSMMGAIAQLEREQIAQRTKDKMAATRRKGMYTGGKPPLGYKLVEKKLVVDPDEAEVVREIFELFSRLKCVAHVVAELNRRGRTTKRHRAKNGCESGGAQFDRETVRRILESALYIGRVRYEGELFDAPHEALVAEKTWNAAQELLANQSREHRPHRYQVALLRGLLYCAKCGEPMRPEFTRKGARRYPFYVCATLKKRGADACPGSRVAAHTIDEFVATQIRAIGRDPKLVAEVARQLPRDVDPDDLRATLARFDPLWDALTTAERAELLQQLVERVEFDGEAGDVVVRFHETGLAGLGEETAA